MPVTLSLILNLLVLTPVCASLVMRVTWTEESFGPPSPARGILLSVYGAIFVLSVGLLVWPEPAAVAALFAVQVVYKLTTPFTVGTLRNPVVVSNLGIAAVHAGTLFSLVGGL